MNFVSGTMAEKSKTIPTGAEDEENSIKLPLEWEIHPFRERKTRGIVALIIIVAFSTAAAVWMNSIFWGFFALAALFLGLARFFFPTYYIIDSKGIREIFMGTQKVVPWSRFRRAVRQGNEVFLSPFPRRHFMDRFRGLLVVAPDEKVAKFIAKKVNDAAR